MICYSKNLFYLLIFILLQGCAGSGVAPVTNRTEIKESSPVITTPSKNNKNKAPQKSVRKKIDCYVVAKGDTLYSIAWRYNYDYKKLANWNNIAPPYIIHLGKNICFKPTQKKKITRLKSKSDNGRSLTRKKKDTNRNIKNDASIKNDKSSKNTPQGKIKWFWPTQGRVVKSNSPTSKKGMDISGSLGQTIKAAASGEIVYSGSGLVGYGKLIIIKHNDKFLSAYAYNSELLVKEGDVVKAGQKISKMGQDHTGRNMLHFEIRLNGQPVNPLRHLPKKRA